MRRLGFALPLLAFLLSACATPHFDPEHADLPPGVLPTRTCGQAFLVDATINGRGPYALLIDTGAGDTCLSSRVAAQLSADCGRCWLLGFSATGGMFAIHQVVHVRELRVGDATIRGFDAAVFDLHNLETILGGRCDGVLGYSAFRTVLLTLDYPAGAVRIDSGRLDPSAGPGTVPLLSPDSPTIHLDVNGATVRALIDTGDSSALQLPSSLRPEFVNPPRPVGSALAADGPAVFREGRLRGSVALAGITLMNPIIDVGPVTLVGADVLRHFVVTLDQRSRLVRFTPQTPGPVLFRPVFGLGDASVPTPRQTLRVTALFPGSPAQAAGLRIGDEIVAIDGRPIPEIACLKRDYWDNRTQTALSIRRGQSDLTIDCPVAVLVP